jgi:predicted metalloprotease
VRRPAVIALLVSASLALVGCGDGGDGTTRTAVASETATNFAAPTTMSVRTTTLQPVPGAATVPAPTSLVARAVASLAVGDSQPLTQAPEGFEELVRFVADNLDQYWHAAFRAGYRSPRLELPESAFTCGGESVDPRVGPVYCSVQETIYIPRRFEQDLQRLGIPRNADFAIAYVVAHEWGHHIQNLLGLTEQFSARAATLPPVDQNALSVLFELQADCLAGVWAKSAYRAQLLDPGDVEEAQGAARSVGDDTLGASPENFTHRSAEQRLEWLMRGYRTGNAEQCDPFVLGADGGNAADLEPDQNGSAPATTAAEPPAGTSLPSETTGAPPETETAPSLPTEPATATAAEPGGDRVVPPDVFLRDFPALTGIDLTVANTPLSGGVWLVPADPVAAYNTFGPFGIAVAEDPGATASFGRSPVDGTPLEPDDQGVAWYDWTDESGCRGATAVRRYANAALYWTPAVACRGAGETVPHTLDERFAALDEALVRIVSG